MGILKRAAFILRANINEMLEKAEDAEKTLNRLITDMREQLEEAKDLVAISIADEKRLKRYIEREESLAGDWERKALKAVEEGEDDRAKEALTQKWKSEQAAAGYRKSWERQKEMVENLKDALKALKDKLEAAGKHRSLLLARKRGAKAAEKIHRSLASMTDQTALHAFRRAADKIERIEFHSLATVEIMEELKGDETDRQLEELESGFDPQKALRELKGKMGRS